MLIAIDKGLEGIKKELVQRGYKVVYYDEYNHPIDAYIYAGRNESMFSDKVIGSTTLTNVNHGAEKLFSGVVLINGSGLCIENIERELQKQRYVTGNFF